MLSDAERQFVERMPKAELHVHLEGSVRPETLLDLGARHGLHYPFGDAAGARDWYRFRDFPHFVQVYMAICDALRTPDDIERVTYELGEDAARQRIRYLEVIISPTSPLNPRTPATPDVYLAGARAGAARVLRDFGVRMQFQVDGVRSRTPDDVLAVASWCADHAGDGLIGFNLGGMERGYPASRHAAAIARARQAGLRVSLHAGETDGPASIWDALTAGAERIGHGVTSVADPRLVEHLVAERVVLEVSPTSNLRLGVAPSYVEHPFRALHDAGVPVTVNSDDPPMFGTTLTGEYLVLAEHQGFTLGELVDVNLRAVRAAFLPEEERTVLEEAFATELEALRRELSGVDPSEGA